MTESPRFFSRRGIYLVLLAAMVCILILMWTRYRTSLSRITQSEIPIQTLNISHGDQVELSLSDGTQVTLDSGSSFQYPEIFSSSDREVFLVGEALFEVPLSGEKPFVIHAPEVRISFQAARVNVRAWERNRSVEVAVDQGSVTLGPGKSDGFAPLVVQEGYGIRIDQGQALGEPQPVDLEKQLGWIRREADFQDAQLSEVLYRLERWYNIKFVLQDPSIAFIRLTVFLDSMPIDEILELITSLTVLTYERSGNLVLLSQENRV